MFAYVIHQLGCAIEDLVAALEIRIALMHFQEMHLQLGQVLGTKVAQITVGAHIAGDGLFVAFGQLRTGTALGLALQCRLQFATLNIGWRTVCCFLSSRSAARSLAVIQQLIKLLGERQRSLVSPCNGACLALRLELVLQPDQRHLVCKPASC